MGIAGSTIPHYLVDLNPLWLVGVETGARLSWTVFDGTKKVLGSASTLPVRYSRAEKVEVLNGKKGSLAREIIEAEVSERVIRIGADRI